jgi:hypothetical protein
LKFNNDIAYLTDLCNKFNETNLQLQGDVFEFDGSKGNYFCVRVKTCLVQTKFWSKIILSDSESFLCGNNDDDILVFCQHLEALKEDFTNRFQDVLNMIIPNWVLKPFSNLQTAELSLQEELIELSNEELKLKLKNGYKEFWLQRQIPVLYPALWVASKKFFIAFPSPYLAERGFSVVSNLLTKKRNRLSVERGDLRLLMTNMAPNIEKSVSLHQAQPSH